MRTTITIDDDLLAQVKEAAARSHRTVSAVLEDAVRESLARQPSVDRQRVALPVSGDPSDRPLIDILDRHALAAVLEDDRL